jgi:hypothetical protein
MKIPLAICLFTTTKGHHDVKTRWRETVQDLHRQIPLDNFAGLFANIKAGNESEEQAALDIAKELHNKYGFENHTAIFPWKHGDNSHQVGYLNDIFHIYNLPEVLKNQYVMHLEDDWLIRAEDGELLKWIAKAIKLLDENPDILQVRFPRFSNEFLRINNLKSKHNIDTWARDYNDDFFVHSDFSLNPSIFRSRDLRNATLLMKKNANVFGSHVEHDFGRALKYFSHPQENLACFCPEKARCYHLGAPLGQEDKIGEQLNSN